MSVTPLETLQAVCEAWNRLDVEALAVLFAEDGSFEDPLVPGGPVTGPDGVRGASGEGMAVLAQCDVTISHGVEQGDLGMAEGMFRSTLAEGGAFDFPFVMVVELRGGKIARLSEYFDTAPLT
jgi:ketosteroid isomerase-like protein